MAEYLQFSNLSITPIEQSLRPTILVPRSPGTVFLSHSHSDHNLINSTTDFLNTNGGGDIYIDWLDELMPEKIGDKSVEQIRKQIDERYRFVVLATESALHSPWVSWELGFADGIKQFNEIALLPVEETKGSWKGAEYGSFYAQISQNDDGTWWVRFPGSDPVTLDHWLHQESPITRSIVSQVGCFPTGSQVLLKSGRWKSIEKLKPGDELTSYNRQLKQNTVSSVKGVVPAISQEYIEINKTFRTTKSQKIIASDKLMPAKRLCISDVLKNQNGESLTIHSIKVISSEIEVFRVDLSNMDDFYVDEVLVGNSWTKGDG